jgi:UDP-N-acetylmuramoylalanine--D-glutamate ligase
MTSPDIQGKHVLVVGMGASGAAAAAFLNDRGAVVTVADRASVPDAVDQIPVLEARGIRFELEAHRTETFHRAEIIVVSPGVPHRMALLQQAIQKGIPVISELELASRYITKPIIAVTGTNGKTTTTTLLSHLLQNAGFRVVAGGNIGTPLVDCIDAAEAADVLVVEVSSFQLDTIDTFQPRISMILNITPDHLDRYDGMAAYAQSKGRILKNQTESDIAVLNGNDPEVRRISGDTAARKWFINAGPGEEGGAFQGDRFILQTGDHEDMWLDLSCLTQPGHHSRENAAAAGLAALAFGADVARIQAALSTFQGLPHRITYAGTVGGVRFYDDSKATNIDAVKKALEAFDSPVVLIMGGRNKGYRFDSLAGAVKDHVKALIVIGESASDILTDLGHLVPGEHCTDMIDAVSRANTLAVAGDVVLLSPGCASFDMFKNYAHRGEAFCKAVADIEKKSLR